MTRHRRSAPGSTVLKAYHGENDTRMPNPLDISDEKLTVIRERMKDIVVPAGHIIVRQGDPGDGFYLINSGRVRVYRKSSEGMEIILSELGTGESFGEMSLVTGEPRSAYVEALTETSLSVLVKDQFEWVLARYPDISINFVKQIAKWIRRDELRLEEETERQIRKPEMSWIDFVAVIGLSLLFGIIFNYSNPNGIGLMPKAWTGESVAMVDPGRIKPDPARKEILYVDARPAGFFERSHIRNAVNIPPALFDIMYLMSAARLGEATEIIVYGRTISSLYDLQVARKLILRGHANVKILRGGLSAWTQNGYPVEP